MKRNLTLMGLGGLIAAAVLHAPAAHADGVLTDYEAYAVDDSWVATCQVLDENVNGVLLNDAQVAVGIAMAIGQHYGLSNDNAVDVENQQVSTYCPRHWPTLVRIGNAARSAHV